MQGRATAREVSRQHSTADTLTGSQIILCGIYGEQSGTGTGFSSECFVSPPTGSFQKILQTHSFIYQWHYTLPVLTGVIQGHWVISHDLTASFYKMFARYRLAACCRFRALLLRLITLSDTHSVGLPWTRDRPVTRPSSYRTHNKHILLVRFEPAIKACQPLQLLRVTVY